MVTKRPFLHILLQAELLITYLQEAEINDFFLPIIFSSLSYSFIQCFLFFILLSMFIDWYKTDGSLNWIIPSSLNLVSLFIAGFCL